MYALINGSHGLCGNMFLGACIHAGVPLEYLRNNLSLLPVRGWNIRISEKKSGGIRATYADVHAPHEHHHRHLTDILQMIEASSLPDPVKQSSTAAFNLLAAAEASAHGIPQEQVHFHEVGAVDAIIDIVGTFLCFHFLHITHVYATPINLGGGTVTCAHGTLPVPVPAVQYLLEGIPVYSDTADYELTTPTGAAILRSLEPHFAGIPAGRITAYGYGAGFYDRPGGNFLSLTLFESIDVPASSCDRVTEIETNIDDRNPELFEPLIQNLFAAGALDVFLTPVLAKRSRLSSKLTVLCLPQDRDRLTTLILQQSGTFGVRYCDKDREKLVSTSRIVSTPWGDVPFRIGRLNGKVVATKPEYEACRQLAEKLGIPIQQMYDRISAKGDFLYELRDTGRESSLPEDQG